MTAISHLAENATRIAAQYVILVAERAVRGRLRRTDFGEMRSFVFLQHEQALGSAIHATPAIEAVKRAFPAASIVAAASGMALDVLRQNPFIDRLVPTPSPYNQLWTCCASLRRAFREVRQPACIVTTQGSSRSRIALLAVLGGSALRAGNSLAPLLYHRLATYDPHESLIRNNLRLLEALGAPYQHYEPRVWFSAEDLSAARKFFQNSEQLSGRPVAVFVTQPSGGQLTNWPKERFAAVANYVAEAHGYGLLFVGTAGQAAAIDDIRRSLAVESVSIAGKTSILELAAVMSLSDLAISLDTGPMHIGRAVQLPMVVIAPAWQRAIEWLPLGMDHVEVLRGKDIPTAHPGYMIEEISAADAVAAVDKLILRCPPSPLSRQARIERSLAMAPGNERDS